MSAPYADEPDISMWVYWWSGERLVTRELALALASRLVLNKFGAADLDAQMPFRVVETEKTWIVAGSESLLLRPLPDQPAVFGKIEIVVSKKDCRVLSFAVRTDPARSE